MVTHTFAVETAESGQRIDHILRQRFPQVSRTMLKCWFVEARVSLAGKRAQKGDRVRSGQLVVVKANSSSGRPVHDPDVALEILFETENVVVLNKAAGIACVPLKDGERGTVVNGLLARYKDMRTFGYSARDAGLIHRLDTNTSGVLVAAKTAKAFAVLVNALKRGQLRKSYLAFTTARPSSFEGTIDVPLRPDPNNRRKVRVAISDEQGARPSRTHYCVLRYTDSLCLIRAEASVATRHQVRAHLASVGCPLLADTLYGGAPDARIQRHALHAERVTFDGLEGVESFDCTSPLPLDLARLEPDFVRSSNLDATAAPREEVETRSLAAPES